MACTQVIKGIARSCDTSKGGIVEAYVANIDEVKFTKEKVSETSEVIKEITSIEAANPEKATPFHPFYFRKNTGSMTSTLQIDAASGSNYCQTELVLQFSRMDTEKRVEMAALATGQICVVVKDANGKYWVLGAEEPVEATAGEGTTGTNRTDGNQYQITLTDTSSSFAPELVPGVSGVDAFLKLVEPVVAGAGA